jgi:hypothetical protein
MIRTYFTLLLSMFSFFVFGQTTIFSENNGTPTGNTSISAYSMGTAPATFQNIGSLLYSNGSATNSADIRVSNASTTYSGASGGGNVFFTTTSGQYGFSIENINSFGYTAITLQFGYRKENSSNHATFAVEYFDGTVWQNIANTSATLFSQTATASNGWYLSNVLSLPSGAALNNLKLRFLKSGTLSIRIDDIILKGNPTNLPPSINSSLTSSATFNSPYTYTVTASNTPTSFAASGLPSGLTIDTSTGIISGTPASGTASATTYAVMLSATNVNGTGTASLNLTVNKANQTITFGPLANVLDNAPNFALVGTSTSGLPITYSSSMPAVAAIVLPDNVDPIAPGMTIITASQSGNGDYNPATNVDQNLTVVNSTATPQTINFTLASPVTYGDAPISLNGVATSSLPVSYMSSNTAVATISGSTLTIVGAGTATITASQAGDLIWAPAPEVMQTLVVDQKPLVVIGATAANKPYDGNTTATITGSSLSGIIGMDVVNLSAANANFNTADAGTMKPITTNYSLIGANAANYSLPSQPLGIVADITPANQTIVFPVIPTQGLTNITYTLNATTNSGLPITYTSSNTTVATVSGNVVTLLSLGTSQITASQAGSSNYNAATDVVRALNVEIIPVMYSFGSGTGTLMPTAGVPVSNLTFSGVTRVSPINATSIALTSASQSNYVGASAFVNIGNASKVGPFKVDSSAYFEITITPENGFRVRLDSVSFGSRATGTGPQTYALYSNKDFYNAPIATISAGTSGIWSVFKPLFDTISNGNNPLTLRIYGYNGAGNAVAGTVNWRLDDISVKAIAKPFTCTPPSNISITSSSSQALCSGQNVLLTASGATSYLWEVPGNIITDTLRVAPNATKPYIVRGYSTGECYAKDTITVNVEGLLLTNGANSGIGSLRSIIGCATTGSIITVDPSITSIDLTAPLSISGKILTIKDADMTPAIITLDSDVSNLNISPTGIAILDNLHIKDLSVTKAMPVLINDGTLTLKNTKVSGETGSMISPTVKNNGTGTVNAEGTSTISNQ